MIAVAVFASSITRRISAEPLWSDVCTQVETNTLPFCDTTKNLDERIDDYVKRIPIENQITMMGNNASGYDELKIPPYQWWSEGLHGPLEPCVQYENTCACPTSFPSPSAMGNAFNRTLYRLVGRAIGIEGRSISNLRKHNMAIGDGLTYWSVNCCSKKKKCDFSFNFNFYYSLIRYHIPLSFSLFKSIGHPPLTCNEIHVGVEIKRFQVRIHT